MHNINKTDKQEGREMGWHGLTEVKSLIELAKCWLSLWDIKFIKSYIRNPFYIQGTTPPPIITADTKDTWSEFIQDPDGYGRFAATDDESIIIGKPITDTYGAISNKAFLTMIEDALKGTPHEIWSVGSVRSRGRVFVSVKLQQDYIRNIGHREFKDFLNFGNSHDLSSSCFINNTSTCTVCDNTFTSNLWAAKNAQVISGNEEIQDATNLQVRHSKNAIKRLPEISKLLDKALGVRAEFYKALASLDTTPIGADAVREVFAGFEGKTLRTDTVLTASGPVNGTKGLSTRTLNKVARLTGLFSDESKGNRGKTLLDAFSAVTDFYSHESSGSGADATASKLRQIESSEFAGGSGYSRKQDFFAVLTTVEDGKLAKLENTRKLGQTLLAASAN